VGPLDGTTVLAPGRGGLMAACPYGFMRRLGNADSMQAQISSNDGRPS
jgi:hypothetical protein